MKDLPQRYTAALEAHLKSPSEETLAGAYTLGRAVLAEGGSLIDVTQAHHHALARLTGMQLEAAGAFLAEVMSVFEMANRGYRDAIAELQRRNRELEIAKEAALAANKELEAFSYSVSHDLRAPLRAVDGFSRALEEDNGEQLDEVGHSHLKRVRDATKHMSQLIDDLLSLARLSRGELARETVDLSELVRFAIERLRRADPSRKVMLDVPEHLMGRADPRLIGVAIENLISNAWKFTAKRARAHITVSMQPGTNVFFVRDDGAGFDMRLVDRLFGAFQRLHSQAEFEGSGIGLATVQRIIRRHGGRIWAEGAVGQGATFYFTLGE